MTNLTPTQLKTLTRLKNEFPFFLKHIFYKKSDYKAPPHILEWAKLFQDNKFISLMSARKHLKSTLIYAYLMWKIFINHTEKNLEILYLSYNNDLAAYHVSNIKEMIIKNPWFYFFKHHTDAESVLNCSKVNNAGKLYPGKITITPAGIMSFKRGMHPDIVICDDILADPTNILEPAIIEKINRVFFEDIMSLPKEGGELKLAGTPQHQMDLFQQLKVKKSYAWYSFPAIINDLNKEVLWPGVFSYERLMQIRVEELGDKAFKKEYMCSPVYTEEGYFVKDQIDVVVDKNLRQMPRFEDRSFTIIAGWDIGKHAHPSHIAVFREDGALITMIYEQFMDNMEYIKQVAIVNGLVERFKIDKVYYDATRGELEGFVEQRIMVPKIYIPVKFSLGMKNTMASEFEKRVIASTLKKDKGIVLLNDQRMINQILSVTNDLQAMETNEGHGDAFWSIAMACYGMSLSSRKSYIIG